MTDCCISALRESDGSIVSDVVGLCNSASPFYSALFSSVPTDPTACDSLFGKLDSVLSPQQAASCEGLLTLE